MITLKFDLIKIQGQLHLDWDIKSAIHGNSSSDTTSSTTDKKYSEACVLRPAYGSSDFGHK